MELTGPWLATVADEDLRREYPDVDFDDSTWSPITVPGHWQSSPEFSDTTGPLLYRTRFSAKRPAAGRRSWLTLDGLFYQGDVWLDGGYVGDTEGYFFPHTFEVTDAMTSGADHVLAVEATCAPQRDRTAKRNITGVFQHWDCIDPEWNPGGLWRPIHVVETGPVRIARLRVICTEATAEQAVLALTAHLDTVDARTVHLRTTIAGVDLSIEQPLAAGDNTVEWTVTIPRPELWWPHSLGEPTMHEVVVEVRLADAAGSLVSDRRKLSTGLRTIQWRKWTLTVNGEQMFLKGSNLGPTRMQLAEATPAELARDVELAVEANLDFLRVHAHVTRPEFYEAADAAGLLIWQDMPLQWGYARSIRKQAVRQTTEAVDLLGHHPSIFLWCGHNEPMAIDLDPGKLGGLTKVKVGAQAFASQQLPTWNKTVLDRSIKKAFEKADPSRPVVAHSGVLPHLPQLDGTDGHLYFGWYWGDERDFPGFVAGLPKMARFLTEFGAQAVPNSAEFVDPDRWPELDWEHLEARHAYQPTFHDRYVPREGLDFDGWRLASQRYQADVARFHIETIRRLKYRPAGGFAHFSFADSMPSITWAVLGHDRSPKLAYQALKAACAPVIIVVDRPPAQVRPGERLALDVHVVSDIRTPIEAAKVHVTVAWDGGSLDWTFGGDVEADSVVKVGGLDFTAPEVSGPVLISLRLEGAPDVVEATYDFTVVA
ncbi:MAG TPA: hypothetical protein VMW08_09270 [Acidimicrobiales bacterium]|nr:hypothetical protein [Acidimicrobiales bacterium]